MPTYPYSANPVPRGGDITQLERFLEDELGRIATAIRATTVQAAYGGLTIDTPITDTVGTTPTAITDWETSYPARPSRVITSTDTGTVPDGSVLVPEEDGVYELLCQINVEIDSGRVYNLTLHKNDDPTIIYGTWDTSNQSDHIWMIFCGMVEAQAGDVFSVWANANQDSSTFNIQSGNFQCFRVSELLNHRG
ncbi:MAG: hypothetical protein GY746_13685 [Gammaproteobacteria bacterium]|nr:hypothetical protein [Gammaproteobacteria bacterium]